MAACSNAPRTSEFHPTTTSDSAPVPDKISDIPVQGFSTCRLLPDDFRLLTDIANRRVVPNTESSKEGGRIVLSDREMSEWGAVISRMSYEPVPLVVDPKAAQPVFVAVFDGTWNDRKVKAEPLTVPAHLSLELEAMAAKANGLRVVYYHGVGTRVSFLRRLWEGATGAGTRERAEQAFSDLNAFAAREGKTPHVYTIGFSRGAASARHFLNLADKVLRADPEAGRDTLDRPRSFALLFDTVATGRSSQLELGIPSTTAAAFHFVATHERRLTFPVVGISSDKTEKFAHQRIVEVKLPGAHSNLGGGYGTGLEELSLLIARDLLKREGFDVKEQKVRQQAILNMGRHNSDWPGTAAANALSRLAGAGERRRIEPKATTDAPAEEVSSTDDVVRASLERSKREIAASLAELERVRQASRRGEAPVFDGLSIQLEAQGPELLLVTNCPKSVAFDLSSRWLLLDGQPYMSLTEATVSRVKRGEGLLMIIDRKDAADFKSAALRDQDAPRPR